MQTSRFINSIILHIIVSLGIIVRIFIDAGPFLVIINQGYY